MSTVLENIGVDVESGSVLETMRFSVEGEERIEAVVREYQDDVDIRNEEVKSCSKQTSDMQDVCAALLDPVEQMGRT